MVGDEVIEIFELQAGDVLERLLFVGGSVVQQRRDTIDLAPQRERHICFRHDQQPMDGRG